jgi:hypothetical protein
MATAPKNEAEMESYGLPVPLAEASRRSARIAVARLLRRDELVWLLTERYNAEIGVWQLELLRTGGGGRWVRQRYHYDSQAETIYYMGESALDDAAFRAARAGASAFPIAELQDA